MPEWMLWLLGIAVVAVVVTIVLAVLKRIAMAIVGGIVALLLASPALVDKVTEWVGSLL